MGNYNDLISVIVPVYNVEKYLNRAVDSILAQTYQKLEIILVDDGSTDRSGAICDAYAEKDSRIKVIHKPNGGPSEARNVGIRASAGVFIGFVDSDDYIEPDMYEFLYNNLIRENADVSICGIFSVYNNKVEKIPSPEYFVLDSKEAIQITLEAEKFSVTSVNRLYRKQLFDSVLFPEDKIMAEDAILNVDILLLCDKVVFSTVPKYYYYHRSNSLTTSAFRPEIMGSVEAYQRIYDTLEKQLPELLDVAQMRLCWATFFVLDRLVQDSSGKYLDLRAELVEYIMDHISFILADRHFTKARKLSAILLILDWRLYKICVTVSNKRPHA